MALVCFFLNTPSQCKSADVLEAPHLPTFEEVQVHLNDMQFISRHYACFNYKATYASGKVERLWGELE